MINWYPSYMKNKYISWVENLKWDWCISRQRYFGVPFPIWYCKKCGEPIYAAESQLPVNPLEDKPIGTCSCGCKKYIAENAVFDTWATSSLTPMINAGWGTNRDYSDKLIPMGMRTQAYEIIRTWAFYTIVRSLYHLGRLPWKDIMISGFVLAKRGEKISKSKNNGILSPSELIKKHSADSLRYWAASTKLGTDTMFSEEDLKLSKRFLTKLWNSSKFAIMQLDDYKGEKPAELMIIDQWILNKLAKVEEVVTKYLVAYEIGLAKQEIDKFFWTDFCDNYIEITKDRLYKPEIHGQQERKSAQYALYHVLLEILKMYSIYVPYITEEIYQSFYRGFEKEISIHKLEWNKEFIYDDEILEFGEMVKEIISEVRKYKSEKNLSLKEEINILEINLEADKIIYLEQTIKDIKSCTWAKEIRINETDSFRMNICQ